MECKHRSFFRLLILTLFVIFLQENFDCGIGQTVAEGDEGLLELVEVDVARVVSVKPAKAMLPIRYVFPQAGKLVESNGSWIKQRKRVLEKNRKFYKIEKDFN